MEPLERMQDKAFGATRVCSTADWAPIVLGGLLAGFGLARRSLPGLLMAGLGGAIAYRSLRRLNPTRPTLVQPTGDGGFVGEDLVDEASWESFPASDAPGY